MQKLEYNKNSAQSKSIDALGNETTYQYDKNNRLIYTTDPLGKVEGITYDDIGNVATKTDSKGEILTYVYDIHQRLTEEKLGEKVLKAYEYDNNSNELSVTDDTGITTFTYDEENRLLTKNIPNMGTLTYTYDIIELAGDGETKVKITDPKGNQTLKTFDKAERLKTVENYGEVTTYTYYDNGSRKEVLYPNGVSETFEYNDRGEITTLTNEKSNGTTLEEYTYTYDNNGNQLSKTDSVGTTSYTYDSLNRLKTAQEPNGKATTYTFDGAGNRTAQIISDGVDISLTKYTYNNENHLKKETTQYQGNTNITNYEYDNNGNVVSKSSYKQKPTQDGDIEEIDVSTAGDGKTKDITLYEYDLYNQLIKTITDNKTVTYSYDSQGYRIEKNVKTIDIETMEANTESERYLYSGDKVILETDLAGNETAVNIYGMNLISRKADETKLYYLYNAHADVTGLADSGGDIKNTYRYDAFGNIIDKTGEAINPYTYAGYRYDEESDLYYLNARYYDAKIARFLTVDTYRGQLNDPLSLNLYTYCVNNPIKYYDPTGHYLSTHDRKYLSKRDRKRIERATRAYDRAKAAGDTKGMKKAHKDAERIRAKKGYSGGDDGSKHHRRSSRRSSSSSSYSELIKNNDIYFGNIVHHKDTNSIESDLSIDKSNTIYAGEGVDFSSKNHIHKDDYNDIVRGESELIASLDLQYIPDIRNIPGTDINASKAVLDIAREIGSHAKEVISSIGDKSGLLVNRYTAGGLVAGYIWHKSTIYAGDPTEEELRLNEIKDGTNESKKTDNEVDNGEVTGKRAPDGDTVTSNKGNTYDNKPSDNHSTTTGNPIRGEPNSSVDIMDKNGNVIRRRWFGSDGEQSRDLDYTNHGNSKQHPERPHEHGPRIQKIERMK